MTSPNADLVRHVRVWAQFPDLFEETLRTQAEDGFALVRIVPHTPTDYVAVFMKPSPIGRSEP
jgi:hypothetical protein